MRRWRHAHSRPITTVRRNSPGSDWSPRHAGQVKLLPEQSTTIYIPLPRHVGYVYVLCRWLDLSHCDIACQARRAWSGLAMITRITGVASKFIGNTWTLWSVLNSLKFYVAMFPAFSFSLISNSINNLGHTIWPYQVHQSPPYRR